MEPVYLSPAQAYHNSAEMEAGLAYEMPNWCYSRIANPSTNYLEETAALLETYGSPIVASCVATSSGMAAIRTATDPFLARDDRYPNPNIVRVRESLRWDVSAVLGKTAQGAGNRGPLGHQSGGHRPVGETRR